MLNIEGESKWLYGSNTVSNKIVLYGFAQASGNILGTSYVGSSNPYSFASLTQTSNEGIAILAKTALEGRFLCIAWFKHDANYLQELLQ